MGTLCRKHRVVVVSDCGYVPFASVSDDCQENSVTCIAPTKAFNLAGLQTAAVQNAEPEALTLTGSRL